MKKIKNLAIGSIALFALLTVFFVACKKTAVTNQSTAASSEYVSIGETSRPNGLISICCDIARVKYDCLKGGGLCNCKIVIGNCISARAVPLTAKISGNNLFITAEAPLPADAQNEFIIDEEMSLEIGICDKLGCESVTILPGTYAVHNEDNKQKIKLDIVKVEK